MGEVSPWARATWGSLSAWWPWLHGVARTNLAPVPPRTNGIAFLFRHDPRAGGHADPSNINKIPTQTPILGTLILEVGSLH